MSTEIVWSTDSVYWQNKQSIELVAESSNTSTDCKVCVQPIEEIA